ERHPARVPLTPDRVGEDRRRRLFLPGHGPAGGVVMGGALPPTAGLLPHSCATNGAKTEPRRDSPPVAACWHAGCCNRDADSFCTQERDGFSPARQIPRLAGPFFVGGFDLAPPARAL